MFTSIVLAGGKGWRLGRDKATVLLAGEGLLHRVVSRLSPLGPVLVVVVRGSSLALPPGAERVGDVFPGKGALGGVYSGLKAAATPGIREGYLKVRVVRLLALGQSFYSPEHR